MDHRGEVSTPFQTARGDAIEAVGALIARGLKRDESDLIVVHTFGGSDGFFAPGAGIFASFQAVKVADVDGITPARALALELRRSGESVKVIPFPPISDAEKFATPGGTRSFAVAAGQLDFMKGPIQAGATVHQSASFKKKNFAYSKAQGIPQKGKYNLGSEDEAQDYLRRFLDLQGLGYGGDAENMPWYLFVVKPAYITSILFLLLGPLYNTIGDKHYAKTPAKRGEYNPLPAWVVSWVVENAFLRQLPSAEVLHAFWKKARDVDNEDLAKETFQQFNDLRHVINVFTGVSHTEIHDDPLFVTIMDFMLTGVNAEEHQGIYSGGASDVAFGQDGASGQVLAIEDGNERIDELRTGRRFSGVEAVVNVHRPDSVGVAAYIEQAGLVSSASVYPGTVPSDQRQQMLVIHERAHAPRVGLCNLVSPAVYAAMMNEFALFARAVQYDHANLSMENEHLRLRLASMEMKEVLNTRGIVANPGQVVVAGVLRGLPAVVWEKLFASCSINDDSITTMAERQKFIDLFAQLLKRCHPGADDGKQSCVKGGDGVQFKSFFKGVLERTLTEVVVHRGKAKTELQGEAMVFDSISVRLFFAASAAGSGSPAMNAYAARAIFFGPGNDETIISNISELLEDEGLRTDLRLNLKAINVREEFNTRALVKGFNAQGYAGFKLVADHKGSNGRGSKREREGGFGNGSAQKRRS
jgi:hypothetical protein